MAAAQRIAIGDIVKVVLMGTVFEARVIDDLGPLSRDGKRIFSVQLTDPDMGDDPPRFDVLEEWLEQIQAGMAQSLAQQSA